MTTLAELLAVQQEVAPEQRTRRSARVRTARVGEATRRSTVLWLVLIGVVQAVLANRPGLNENAFEDEGLYVFIGHRMIDRLLHGTHLTEYPGTYFSGSPGLYPVLAAVGDSVAGLPGARSVSLLFVIASMVCVYGLGHELFGRAAGLVGAAAFAVCGSVVFQSHLATYDSMAMCFIAGAAWLTVRSAKRDLLLWAPVVALLLAIAFLAKYAAATYAPVVALLAVAVAWRQGRWTVAVRAAVMVVSAVVIAYFVIGYWGAGLAEGIRTTTASRVVLSPASAQTLVGQVAAWVGPWLALAALAGALRLRKEWRLVAVLLLGSVITALAQIRIGEATSLSKHVAFGMVFAAPLVGDLLARLVQWSRVLGLPIAAAALAGLTVVGLGTSHAFLTGWVDDRDLLPVLQADLAKAPGKVVLGEQPAPQRYALRDITAPEQWQDTYRFFYAGKVDRPAFVAAIQQTHFGIIYLNLQTPNGTYLHDYLTRTDTPYTLTAQVNRYQNGDPVGKWLVYTPEVLERRRPAHSVGQPRSGQRQQPIRGGRGSSRR